MWVTGQSRRDNFDASMHEEVVLLPWTRDDKINADPYQNAVYRDMQ